MEVEVNLRLPGAAASHRLLSSFLAARLPASSAPTPSATSSSTPPRLPLRPRRPHPSRAVLALKRRPRVDAGVSRVEEVEQPLDPALALACAGNPARLAGVDFRLVAAEYGVGGDAAPCACLGGFRNTRAVYELEVGDEGLRLVVELAETRLDFRTSVELTCETALPDRAEEVLERLLTVAGVPYEYARSNKFASFMALVFSSFD